MTTFVGIVLWIIVIALIAAPPRYDPAIRLKEWLESKRKK